MGRQANGSNSLLGQGPLGDAEPLWASTSEPSSPEPEPSVLQLVSWEGDMFEVLREHALASETIRTMLAVPNEAVDGNVIHLPQIRSHILYKICIFFEYKAMQEQFNLGGLSFPEFLIEPETALELLSAAIFLNC